jgi:hypothetical protein
VPNEQISAQHHQHPLIIAEKSTVKPPQSNLYHGHAVCSMPISNQLEMTLAECETLVYKIVSKIAPVLKCLSETMPQEKYKAVLQTMWSLPGHPDAQMESDLDPKVAELKSPMNQAPFVYKPLDRLKPIRVLYALCWSAIRSKIT